MASESLLVFLNGTEVGRMVPTRRGAQFSYLETISETMNGVPLLSLSLPVKRRRYSEGLTASWFRGLLPEGERLRAISQAIGCDEADYVAILSQIGWECAGAVSIYPEHFLPPETTPHVLSDEELATKLRNLPTYGGVEPLAHVSLGGFQEKLLLTAEDVSIDRGRVSHARWTEPDSLSISTHILKPQPQGRYPGITEAEAWAMSVAGKVARCATVSLLDINGAPLTLVVERYDRTRHDGKIARLHQEDCCQAMGIPPHEKYAGTDVVRGSDPSYVKIAGLLERYAESPAEEQSELLRQLIVNVALGNVDAHAKNYALLFREVGVPEVAPMYDVVPVIDIEPRAVYLSMRIGGVIRFEDVGRIQILDEAESWGLQRSHAATVLDDTLERLLEGLSCAGKLYPVAAERHSKGALSRVSSLRKD